MDAEKERMRRRAKRLRGEGNDEGVDGVGGGISNPGLDVGVEDGVWAVEGAINQPGLDMGVEVIQPGSAEEGDSARFGRREDGKV